MKIAQFLLIAATFSAAALALSSAPGIAQAAQPDYFKEADDTLTKNQGANPDSGQGDSLEAPAIKSAEPRPTITITQVAGKTSKICVSVDNIGAFDKALFAPAGYLKPFQQNANASRAIVYIRKSTADEPLIVYDMLRDPHDLQKLTLQMPDGDKPVLILDIWDRMSDRHHVSLPTALRLDNH